MSHGCLRSGVGRHALVLTAVLLCAAGLTFAEDANAEGPHGSASLYPIAPKLGDEKLEDDYIKCGTFSNMSDYHYWYTPSGVTDVFLCIAGEVRTSSGNANLYIHLGGVANDGSTPLPRTSAGPLICSSTRTGTLTDACNGCNYACGYALDQVWRSYAVPASVPTNYCNEVWVYSCEAVDLTHAGAVRDGTAVEVTWEVADERGTAGYKVYRRYDDQEEWTLITPTLVPVSDDGAHRVVDTVPATAGNIYYKLEHVALDGTVEHMIHIAHELPFNDSFPPPVR